jgi:hypothetical protein
MRITRNNRRERNDDDDDRRNNRRDARGKRERRNREDRFNSEAAERYKKKVIPETVAKEVEEQSETEEQSSEEQSEAPERQLRGDRGEKRARVPRGKKDNVKQPKVLSQEQELLRDMLLEMSSTHNAKVLSSENEMVREVAVKELVDSLKNDSEGISKIVFDGVISQRILDVSAEKGVSTVVGTRKGNITKMPAGITIWTKEDLY